MKTYFVLFVCFGVIGALAKRHSSTLSPDIQEAHNKCQENDDTKIDQDQFNRFTYRGRNEFENSYKPHIFCVTKHLQLQNEDGTVNKEKLKQKIQDAIGENENGSEEMQQKILEDCAEEKNTKEKTAFHLYKCLRFKLPNIGRHAGRIRHHEHKHKHHDQDHDQDHDED